MTYIIVLSLATWRLSSLIIRERGPFDIFGKLRRAIDADANGEMGEIQELFSCVWCMSIWVAAVLYIMRIRSLQYVLAASSLAILFEERYAHKN